MEDDFIDIDISKKGSPIIVTSDDQLETLNIDSGIKADDNKADDVMLHTLASSTSSPTDDVEVTEIITTTKADDIEVVDGNDSDNTGGDDFTFAEFDDSIGLLDKLDSWFLGDEPSGGHGTALQDGGGGISEQVQYTLSKEKLSAIFSSYLCAVCLLSKLYFFCNHNIIKGYRYYIATNTRVLGNVIPSTPPEKTKTTTIEKKRVRVSQYELILFYALASELLFVRNTKFIYLTGLSF